MYLICGKIILGDDMQYPNFLKHGSTIGVPAPSDGMKNDTKKNSEKYAEKKMMDLGYNLVVSKNIMNSNFGRSASAIVRANEFNEMFKDNNIDFIICASGGDFLLEMLPYIDFELIKKHPKFVAGFSDPTGIMFPITTKYDIATIYGLNFSTLGTNVIHESEKNFLNILEGNIIPQYSFDLYEDEPLEHITGLEGYNLTHKVYWHTLDNKDVNVKGRIIGGCFDLISEILGTKYDGTSIFNEKYKDDGIIWYFDNCELSMEELIRTLWKLNELDYFKYAKGVIFGRFGYPHTFCSYDTKTCLEDSILKKLNIPIIYDADISHKSPCLPIVNGSIAHVTLENGKATMKFEYR
jgi:muramoyltetrapeptide carboxypeptidase LdcA involved in peptidoglycan recycling